MLRLSVARCTLAVERCRFRRPVLTVYHDDKFLVVCLHIIPIVLEFSHDPCFRRRFRIEHFDDDLPDTDLISDVLGS